MFGRLSH